MERADVTVSIVAHSNRDRLLRSIEALTGVRRPRARIEIVVLDNASTDGTVEALRREHPDVRVIAQQHRDGFAANQNRAIATAQGRYVLLLNDDAVVAPGAVDALVAHLDAHPRTAAVGPRIVSPAGTIQQTAWRFASPAASVLYALTLGQAGHVQSGGRHTRAVDRLSGCALMLRRSALDGVGRLDERFFMYSEDADLCRRLRARGHEIEYVPTAEVTHESQASSAGVPRHRINEQWRSLHRYWHKHHGRRGARVAAIAMGSGLLVMAVVAAAARRLPARLQPARAAGWRPAELRLAASNAIRGVAGDGLRELAEEWNRRASAGRATTMGRHAIDVPSREGGR